MTLKSALPWWAKIAAKIVLRRLPLHGRIWQRLNLFSPGGMLDPDYAIGVFRSHFDRAGPLPPGFKYLELGPGDSLATAAIAWAYGAGGGHLIDNGAYAAADIQPYRKLLSKLADTVASNGIPHPARNAGALSACTTLGELLHLTAAEYRGDGLTGLRQVLPESVDFVFSHAVLEHVPFAEFAATAEALYRAMKPGATGSHVVDFQDHLGGSLNNMRFSRSFWERPWFAQASGFYTNRLRLSQMAAHFRAAGFEVVIKKRKQWRALPLPRARLAPEFQELSDDDLLTYGATLLLRKPIGN